MESHNANRKPLTLNLVLCGQASLACQAAQERKQRHGKRRFPAEVVIY